MQLSEDLQIAVSVALSEARRRRHEFAGLEHLLQALALDAATAEVLRHAGADLDRLKADLERFLDEELEALPEADFEESVPTLGFRRVITHAAGYTESAGSDTVEAHNVLVAILDEEDSHAAWLLVAQGVTRLDVVSYLSHGRSKVDPSGKALGPAERRAALPGAGSGRRLPGAGPEAGDSDDDAAGPGESPRPTRSAPSPGISPAWPARATSTRSSGGPRSWRGPCTSCSAGARTTRSTSATPAWARPPWSRA